MAKPPPGGRRQRAATPGAGGYQLAIQTAFKEARDALVAHRKTREAAEARATQVGALKRSLRPARLRYDNGYSSYLEVLDAERGLFRAELDAIDACPAPAPERDGGVV